MIKVDADDASYLIISLGDPDPDTPGRIRAIDLGVLEWLDRRVRVFDRLRRRGGGNGSQEAVTLLGPDLRGSVHDGE
jgi:hypothetical protein